MSKIVRLHVAYMILTCSITFVARVNLQCIFQSVFFSLTNQNNPPDLYESLNCLARRNLDLAKLDGCRNAMCDARVVAEAWRWKRWLKGVMGCGVSMTSLTVCYVQSRSEIN